MTGRYQVDRELRGSLAVLGAQVHQFCPENQGSLGLPWGLEYMEVL